MKKVKDADNFTVPQKRLLDLTARSVHLEVQQLKCTLENIKSEYYPYMSTRGNCLAKIKQP